MTHSENSNAKTIVCYIIQNLILFLIGGLVYILLENIFRGHSHVSMFILGGIDFLIIGAINEYLPEDMNIFIQSLIGAAVVTVSELITGYIVNIRLGLGVWDYSHLPFNFLGQISLYFSLLWIPVSLLAVVLDDILRLLLFGERLPKYFGKSK